MQGVPQDSVHPGPCKCAQEDTQEDLCAGMHYEIKHLNVMKLTFNG